MIGYVTLGTNDFARAASFYDDLLGSLGHKRFIDSDRFIAWGSDPRSPALGICLPYDGKPATVGNGVMVALIMPSRAKVDELHAKAMELGGSDEGAPGLRMGNFYGGYFRDLDGNKLVAFCMKPE
jgi:catechol 2,3-dioxygenase-like lactoylglutathione lyase family enzyme